MAPQITKIYRELIDESGFLKLTVKGTSMEPLLKDGQQILINKVINYRLGDCYLFKYQNRVILHRLVCKLKDKRFLFIGDNCCKMEIVFEKDIIGCLQEQINCKIQKIIVICLNLLFVNIFNKLPWAARKLYLLRKKLIMLLSKVKR